MSANEFWKVMDKNFLQVVKLSNSREGTDLETKFFEKLLDNLSDINYKIPSNYVFGEGWWAGRTIFQLIGFFRPNLCKILIDRGADYTVTDKRGSTNLHSETSTQYEQYLSAVKLRVFKPQLCANITLDAHINSKNYKNPKDNNGLSHFHVACMYNRADAAKFFLENGVSVSETVYKDSTFYPGYSALHFAVKSWALETVELLLTFGANMFAKDSRGMTPLHVLIADRREIFCILKRITRIALSDEFSDMFNHYSKSEQILYLFLDKMKEFGCYLDNETGLSYFHILCFLGDTSSVKQFLGNNREYLAQSVNIDSPIWSGYTPLHFAAHSNMQMVELLVKNGANLGAKDANGVTPFEICLREFSIAEVHRIFSQQADYISIVFSDGKTKLCDFIHAMQDIVTFENFLKDNFTDSNMFIPFDSPLCAGCTPLHLTIMCTEQPMNWNSKKSEYKYNSLYVDMESEISKKYLLRLESCLRHNPDISCRDSQGLTPLHWAFRLQQSEAVRLLLTQHTPTSNLVDKHGLSHLHIACAAGQEALVRKLLSKGANVNKVVTSNYVYKDVDNSPIFRHSRSIVTECFISKGSTPLHFATSVQCPKVVEILVSQGADVLAKDANGLNPLENLLKIPIFRDSECSKCTYDGSEFEVAIAKLLIREVGDRLADTNPKQMLLCYSLLENRLTLLSEVLSHADESATKILESVGITALHVACFTQNMKRVNELVKKCDVNASVNLESPLWPGCTPLHLLTIDAKSRDLFYVEVHIPPNEAILDELLRNGADVAALNAKGETPIHQMFPIYRYFEGVNKLLECLKDFSVNPVSRRGYTHLHVASACGNVSAVEKLLEHGAVIDQPTDYFIETMYIMNHHAGFTALHLAAAYQRKAVIDVLLKCGADVNRRNAYEKNPLHAAILVHRRQRNFDVLQTLIGAGVDIQARDMHGETSFEDLIKYKLESCTKKEVELFLAHGIRVNTVNPVTGEGLLALALKQSRELAIFEMVVKVSNVKDIDDNERNAIHNVVSYRQLDGHELRRRDFHEIVPSSDNYIRGIDALTKLGLDIDHQDCKGSTPLHIAIQMQNPTGLVGLLENGADINIVDADGKPAFAYSFEPAKLQKKPVEPNILILDIIFMHMYKLNMTRIGISRLNRGIFAEIHERIPLELSGVEQCNDELERLRKEEIISSSVTLYKFLSDTGAVSVFPYMLPCNRIAIGSYFKDNIQSLREKFPEWTGILLLQYRKALVRGDMIDDAMTSLNILVGFDMPAVCSRIIFRFLSNDELINLKKSTDE